MIDLASTARSSVFDLGGTGHYLDWGFVQISVANAVVILSMIVVFVLAILLPFPQRAAAVSARVPAQPLPAEHEPPGSGSWTGWLRNRAEAALPPEKLLPDRQPAYVSSWIYVFGVLTLAAFVVVLRLGGCAGAGRADVVAHGQRSGTSSTACTCGASSCSSSSWSSTCGASSSWPPGGAGGR